MAGPERTDRPSAPPRNSRTASHEPRSLQPHAEGTVLTRGGLLHDRVVDRDRPAGAEGRVEAGAVARRAGPRAPRASTRGRRGRAAPSRRRGGGRRRRRSPRSSSGSPRRRSARRRRAAASRRSGRPRGPRATSPAPPRGSRSRSRGATGGCRASGTRPRRGRSRRPGRGRGGTRPASRTAWSDGRTTRTASGSSSATASAARAMAGAVFRRSGSRTSRPAGRPGNSRSEVGRVRGARGEEDVVLPARRGRPGRTSRGGARPSPTSGRNGFGRSSVERGQRRVPLPPARISARTVIVRILRSGAPSRLVTERPRSSTSGTSSTPKRSRTASRIRAISSLTSAAVAPPAFTMTFA